MPDGRILGIDYGKKRVGLALSDPLGMFASGLQTLTVTSQKKLVKDIQAVMQQNNVHTLVLGLPKRANGQLGDSALAAQELGEALKVATGCPVVYEDERYTSVIAQQTLQAQGVKPSRNKALVDKTAAALILQQYLDKRKNSIIFL